MEKRLMLISKHASPLAATGGVDAGGQNVAVVELATGPARLGYRVDVFTRCTLPTEPGWVQWQPRVRVNHVPAGPHPYLPKEALLPHMDEFAGNLVRFMRQQAVKVRLLLTDTTLPRRYSLAATQHVQTGYTWAQVARQTADLYNLVTSGRIHSGLWLGSAYYQIPTLHKSENRYE